MLKLILDQQFKTKQPAVDLSPFSHHGQVINATFDRDGREAGSGALTFAHANSAVRIAPTAAWQKLSALAIEAWIYVRPTGARRNIVEGDGSFALFIDANDALVGSVYSFVDGAAAPSWNVVSSIAHGIGGSHSVPTNRWCKVVFHHDGITRARLFVDGQLVASRGDYRSAIVGVASAGVVIGNWTLTNQHAFAGAIDSVRIWKKDHDAVLRHFDQRPISPEARDQWHEMLECLRRSTNVDQKLRLRALATNMDDLLRQLFRAVHAASSEDRAALHQFIATYREQWQVNTLASLEFLDALLGMRDWINRVLGPTWLAALEQLAAAMREFMTDADACFDRGRLAQADPQYATFIENAARKLSA